MYKNVGKEIKNDIKAYVIRETVKSALIALGVIIIWWSLIWEYLIVGFIIAAIIVAEGYFRAREKGKYIYAYGEMTERLISIDEKLGKNEQSIPVKKPDDEGNRGRGVPPVPTNPWTCTKCNHRNPGNVQLCELCHKLR